MLQGAVLNDDRLYRYVLWRKWGPGRPLGWIMLNPSTADAELDDPTIRRVIGFSRDHGYDGAIVCNLYALRATDPKVVKGAVQTHGLAYAIGSENDGHIQRMADEVDQIVCAWGSGSPSLARETAVVRMLPRAKVTALRVTQSGHPCHPLYLPGILRAQPWWR